MKLKDLRKLIKTGDPDIDVADLLPQKEVEKIVVAPENVTERPTEDGRYANVRHAVNLGDLYGAMGCIKKYYDVTKRKCLVLQQINRIGQYYAGAFHPTLDENGNPVTCNQAMFDMVKPLIESQEYIQGLEVFKGQRVDIDFDVIRGKTFVNMPHGTLQGWIPLAFTDIAFDISQPWMTVKDECPAHIRGQVLGKVILNFTSRYRENIDYFFLQKYSPDLIFSGTEKEHWDFCNAWGLTIPRLQLTNFLELAHALKTARFSLSNQSMLWNLAQALGTPRVLEMCRFADNCFPNIGEESYGYFYQQGAEYHFRTMYNKTQ